MKAKLFFYNKYKETIDQFEKTLSEFVSSLSTDIHSLSVWETSTGDLAFHFNLAETKTKDFSICILDWLNAQAVESVVNHTIQAAEQAGKKTASVVTLGLSKSPRCLAVIVFAEQSGSSERGKDEAEIQADENQRPNAKPNARAKRKGVS